MLFMMPNFWLMDLNMIFATQVANQDSNIIAAQTILRSFAAVITVIPLSFSCSSGFFIGRAIGNDCIKSIRTYFRVSMYFSLVMGAILVLVLFTAKMPIFHFYTRQEATIGQFISFRIQSIEQLDEAWPWILIFAFFDCTMFAGQGGLRAAGKQGLAAFVTWATLIISLVIIYVMTIRLEKGIAGIWAGPASVMAITTIAEHVVQSLVS